MTLPPPTRLTILISGNGSNLQAVIDGIDAGKLPNASIVRVLSNRKNAYGLERARQAGIPTEYHNLLSYRKRHPQTPEGEHDAREEYDKSLADVILKDSPDLIVCLGFMHILTPRFLSPIQDAKVLCINLHPALPGAFNGVHAIERAHAAWKEGKILKTGIMIHEVVAEVDVGQPLIVKEIPFISGRHDDLEVFEKDLHEEEWGLVIEGIRIAMDRIRSASQ